MAKTVPLEKTLAEIQVLLESPGVLAGASPVSPSCAEYVSYINGINTAVHSILEKYFLAKKFLRKERASSSTNRYFTEFALDAKNLADNLKLLTQLKYSDKEPALRRPLSEDSDRLPKTKAGKRLDTLFSETHDFSNTSILKILRDIKGHSQGQQVVQVSDVNRSRHTLIWPGQIYPQEIDAENWLDEKAHTYLFLAKNVLETFAGQDYEMDLASVYKNRWKNWKGKHKGTVQTIAIAAAVSAGVFGTLLAQEISGRNREKYEKEQIGKILSGASTQVAMRREYGGYLQAIDIPKVRFGEVKQELLDRSKTLGLMVDSYIAKCPAEIDREGKTTTASFLRQREEYLSSLSNLTYDSTYSCSSLDSIKKLADVLKQERELKRMESDIVSFFPRLK